MACLIAVRYRRGVVGETQRMCHLAHVAEGAPIPEVVTALCGQQLPAQLTEQLEMFRGMPCLVCLTLATPSITGNPPTPKKLEFPSSWGIP